MNHAHLDVSAYHNTHSKSLNQSVTSIRLSFKSQNPKTNQKAGPLAFHIHTSRSKSHCLGGIERDAMALWALGLAMTEYCAAVTAYILGES
jgi:hypothetical protein